MARPYWSITRDWDKMRSQAVEYEEKAMSCRLDGKLDEAKKWYKKLIALRDRLLLETGEAIDLCALATSYYDLGDLYEQARDLSDAKDCYERCEELRELLAKDDDKDSFPLEDLADVRERLGALCQTEGDLSAAMGWYEMSVSPRECLSRKTLTDRSHMELAIGYGQAGALSMRKGDLVRARYWCERDLALKERMFQEEDTLQARAALYFCYKQMSDLCQAEGDTSAAEGWAGKIDELDPPDGADEPDPSHVLPVKCLVQHKDPSDMREELSLSLPMIARGACADLAALYEKLGDLCKARGDLLEARLWYEKALEQRAQLAIDPIPVGMAPGKEKNAEKTVLEAHQVLAQGCARLGDLCMQEGNMQRARSYYEKCMELYERLILESEIERI